PSRTIRISKRTASKSRAPTKRRSSCARVTRLRQPAGRASTPCAPRKLATDGVDGTFEAFLAVAGAHGGLALPSERWKASRITHLTPPLLLILYLNRTIRQNLTIFSPTWCEPPFSSFRPSAASSLRCCCFPRSASLARSLSVSGRTSTLPRVQG